MPQAHDSSAKSKPHNLKLKRFLLGFFTADIINRWPALRNWRTSVDWDDLKNDPEYTIRHTNHKQPVIGRNVPVQIDDQKQLGTCDNADLYKHEQWTSGELYQQFTSHEKKYYGDYFKRKRNKSDAYVYLRWLLIGAVLAGILVAFPPSAPVVFAALSHTAWLGLLAGSAVAGCMGLALLADGLAADFSLIKRSMITGKRGRSGLKLDDEQNQSKAMLRSMLKIIFGGILLSLPLALALPMVIVPALKAVGLYAANAIPTAVSTLALIGKSVALCALWQVSFDLIGAYFHKLANNAAKRMKLERCGAGTHAAVTGPRKFVDMQYAAQYDISQVRFYSRLGKFFCVTGFVSIVGAALGAVVSAASSVGSAALSVFQAKAIGSATSVVLGPVAAIVIKEKRDQTPLLDASIYKNDDTFACDVSESFDPKRARSRPASWSKTQEVFTLK